MRSYMFEILVVIETGKKKKKYVGYDNYHFVIITILLPNLSEFTSASWSSQQCY